MGKPKGQNRVKMRGGGRQRAEVSQVTVTPSISVAALASRPGAPKRPSAQVRLGITAMQSRLSSLKGRSDAKAVKQRKQLKSGIEKRQREYDKALKWELANA